MFFELLMNKRSNWPPLVDVHYQHYFILRNLYHILNMLFEATNIFRVTPSPSSPAPCWVLCFIDEPHMFNGSTIRSFIKDSKRYQDVQPGRRAVLSKWSPSLVPPPPPPNLESDTSELFYFSDFSNVCFMCSFVYTVPSTHQCYICLIHVTRRHS